MITKTIRQPLNKNPKKGPKKPKRYTAATEKRIQERFNAHIEQIEAMIPENLLEITNFQLAVEERIRKAEYALKDFAFTKAETEEFWKDIFSDLNAANINTLGLTDICLPHNCQRMGKHNRLIVAKCPVDKYENYKGKVLEFLEDYSIIKFPHRKLINYYKKIIREPFILITTRATTSSILKKKMAPRPRPVIPLLNPKTLEDFVEIISKGFKYIDILRIVNSTGDFAATALLIQYRSHLVQLAKDIKRI